MRTLSRRSFLTAAIAAASLFLASISIPTSKAADAPQDTSKHLKLAFVTNNSSDFWTIARAGVNKAKEEVPNIEVEFTIPGDGQAATQKRLVEDLLVKKMDGIAISPIDPSNQTQFLNDVASKAMLVTQDSDAPKSNRSVYIGTDNTAAGVQAGELLKKVLPSGGKVMVFVGTLDAQNAKDRLAGVKKAIDGTKITIVDVRTDDTDRVRAKANVQDTLVKYPDIAALVGLWSYNGPAIRGAVKDANKVGKVKIVCFDEEADTLAGVKNGEIEGTIVQQPYEFGHQSMIIMAKVLRGDKTAIPASKSIIVPTQVIDKANVDDFSAKLKSYLGK
jgi:ribose transport system substrate-binding protein